MYFSVAFQECRVCPENSEGTMAGLSECPCVEGYYRLSGEEDFPCTRELCITSGSHVGSSWIICFLSFL